MELVFIIYYFFKYKVDFLSEEHRVAHLIEILLIMQWDLKDLGLKWAA